jgi:hypothetical protein
MPSTLGVVARFHGHITTGHLRLLELPYAVKLQEKKILTNSEEYKYCSNLKHFKPAVILIL